MILAMGEHITDADYYPLPADKERISNEIGRQIAEFLSKGGKIKTIPIGETGEDITYRKTKKEQIKDMKRRNRVVPEGNETKRTRV